MSFWFWLTMLTFEGCLLRAQFDDYHAQLKARLAARVGR
jgi:hypothetical protein